MLINRCVKEYLELTNRIDTGILIFYFNPK